MKLKSEDVLVILGAPNDKSGNLLSIAKERADKAIEILHHSDVNCILTGGWGEHFNTTDAAHYEYVKHYIENKLNKPMKFLEGIPSSNSFEDAKMTCEFLNSFECGNIYVITSDFHAVRSGILFNLFSNKNVEIITSITKLKVNDLVGLIQHEISAISLVAKLNGI